MLTYSKYTKAFGLLFASAVLLAGACGSKQESSDGACEPGTNLCPCMENGACNGGLACATNLNKCVQLVGDGSGGATGAGGATGSGGSGTGGSTATGGHGGSGGSVATGGTTGTGGSSATGGHGGSTATGGATATGGHGGSTATGGTTGAGGTTATGGHGGSTATGGTPATGGATGTGGSSATACGTLSPSASGNGEFTYYYFGQPNGTAKGELGDYQTACGYLGTESGMTDTVMNIANTSPAKNTYFAAIPGTGSFTTWANCGACVQISNGGQTIIATIIDECPYTSGTTQNNPCMTNPSGELDLSYTALQALNFPNGNPMGTSWKVVPCPVTGNIIVRVKQVNELYIENVILPITAVAGASRQTTYGAWHFNSNITSGQQLMLTDSANRTLTVTVANTTVDQNQDTGKQFPKCRGSLAAILARSRQRIERSADGQGFGWQAYT